MLGKVLAISLVLGLGSVAPAVGGQLEEKGGSKTAPPKERVLDLGNHTSLEMVLIPAGEFMMGAADSDKDAPPEERPRHRVRITEPSTSANTS